VTWTPRSKIKIEGQIFHFAIVLNGWTAGYNTAYFFDAHCADVIHHKHQIWVKSLMPSAFWILQSNLHLEIRIGSYFTSGIFYTIFYTILYLERVMTVLTTLTPSLTIMHLVRPLGCHLLTLCSHYCQEMTAIGPSEGVIWSEQLKPDTHRFKGICMLRHRLVHCYIVEGRPQQQSICIRRFMELQAGVRPIWTWNIL